MGKESRQGVAPGSSTAEAVKGLWWAHVISPASPRLQVPESRARARAGAELGPGSRGPRSLLRSFWSQPSRDLRRFGFKRVGPTATSRPIAPHFTHLCLQGGVRLTTGSGTKAPSAPASPGPSCRGGVVANAAYTRPCRCKFEDEFFVASRLFSGWGRSSTVMIEAHTAKFMAKNGHEMSWLSRSRAATSNSQRLAKPELQKCGPASLVIHLSSCREALIT